MVSHVVLEHNGDEHRSIEEWPAPGVPAQDQDSSPAATVMLVLSVCLLILCIIGGLTCLRCKFNKSDLFEKGVPMGKEDLSPEDHAALDLEKVMPSEPFPILKIQQSSTQAFKPKISEDPGLLEISADRGPQADAGNAEDFGFEGPDLPAAATEREEISIEQPKASKHFEIMEL